MEINVFLLLLLSLSAQSNEQQTKKNDDDDDGNILFFSFLPIIIGYSLVLSLCLQDELATDRLIDITIEHAMINHRDGFLIQREEKREFSLSLSLRSWGTSFSRPMS